MPIFDQGYQHWDGRLSGHAARWWAIARQGIRAQLRNRRTKYLVISAWVPALMLAAFLALWGLFEQKSDFIKPFLFLFQGLPEAIQQGPRGFRTTIWTFAFHFFLYVEVGLSMILVLLVGPDLISQDLRHNAMPLYLSRPMRRIDYFAGKLAVIVGFLAAVTIVPVVLAYLVGVGFSLDVAVLPDTWRILAMSVLYGFIVAIVSGLVMLAFSSLSRNSRIVALLWVGLWIVGGMMGQILAETTREERGVRDEKSERWRVLSFTENLHRIREAMLDTDSAADEIIAVFTGAADAVTDQPVVKTKLRVLNAMKKFVRRPRPPQPPPGGSIQLDLSESPGRPEAPDREPPLFLQQLTSPYPWTYSAAVLAALCGISICILSTRIRSLDRLR
jgi:ABC-2 type transport system permease protein